MMGLERIWQAVEGWLNAEALDLVLKLMLLQLLVAPWLAGHDGLRAGVLKLLAVIGLAGPQLHRSVALWTAITGLFASKVHADWYTQDNHHFLFFYACLAILIALRDADPDEALRVSARWLLAGCFMAALLWKAWLSPDFRTGAYLEYTLLTDDRFFDLVVWLSDVLRSTLQDNASFSDLMTHPLATAEQVRLHTHPGVRRLADIMTAWTLFVEAIVAGLLLAPATVTRQRVALWVLLVFSLTTYAAIPNVGVSFGWTLLLLGLAVAPQDDRLFRGATGLTLAWVLLGYLVPWLAMLTAASGVGAG